jgi:hypothetical protein
VLVSESEYWHVVRFDDIDEVRISGLCMMTVY